jgi:hypothetical protein
MHSWDVPPVIYRVQRMTPQCMINISIPVYREDARARLEMTQHNTMWYSQTEKRLMPLAMASCIARIRGKDKKDKDTRQVTFG